MDVYLLRFALKYDCKVIPKIDLEEAIFCLDKRHPSAFCLEVTTAYLEPVKRPDLSPLVYGNLYTIHQSTDLPLSSIHRGESVAISFSSSPLQTNGKTNIKIVATVPCIKVGRNIIENVIQNVQKKTEFRFAYQKNDAQMQMKLSIFNCTIYIYPFNFVAGYQYLEPTLDDDDVDDGHNEEEKNCC